MAADTFDLALHTGDVAYGNANLVGGASYTQYDNWLFGVYGWTRSHPPIDAEQPIVVLRIARPAHQIRVAVRDIACVQRKIERVCCHSRRQLGLCRRTDTAVSERDEPNGAG